VSPGSVFSRFLCLLPESGCILGHGPLLHQLQPETGFRPLFFRRTFPGVLLKIVRRSEKYPGHFGIANLGREAATLCLHFRQGFLAFRNDSGKLKQPDARDY
jgi:hypothetical protein